MHKSILSFVLAAPFLAACGASVPPPTQRMADAQSAERSARELGANNQPSAQLALRLAQEQIELARRAMAEGDNQRAEALLLRAKADAELALAQAREQVARGEVNEAIEDAESQKSMNRVQGAAR